RITDEHNPIFVTIFIDVRLNNNVIALYREHENQNREFIQAIQEPGLFNPPPIFERKNLNNNGNNGQRNLNVVKRQPFISIPALAGDGFTNLAEDLTCSLGFWAKKRQSQENVFVSSGRCFRFAQDYYLKPWGLQNLPLPDVRNHIGKMDNRVGHNEISYSILRIEGDVEPIGFIKNIDSPDFAELRIVDNNGLENNFIETSNLGVHLCKSGYHTRVTCGFLRAHSARFFDATDPYIINYVIAMDSNTGDLGGPVYSHYDRARVSIYGIINGAIGDITLSSDVDNILDDANLDFVNFLGE
ncbi:10762_t:CDS:1, partial [Cetraspora pellucida]